MPSVAFIVSYFWSHSPPPPSLTQGIAHPLCTMLTKLAAAKKSFATLRITQCGHLARVGADHRISENVIEHEYCIIQ